MRFWPILNHPIVLGTGTPEVSELISGLMQTLWDVEYLRENLFFGRHTKLDNPIGPHYWEPNDFSIFFKVSKQICKEQSNIVHILTK